MTSRALPRSLAALVVLSSTVGLGAASCGGAPPAPAVAVPAPGVSASPSASSSGAPTTTTKPATTLLVMTPPPAADASISAIAPDPTPLVSSAQWVYDLRYRNGDLFLLGIHRVVLPAPQATPRAMGRFALELYSGPTLLERVRFDFPMMGGAERTQVDAGKAQPLHGANFSFTAKLNTRVGVMFPATDKGNRFVIWDRATDRRWPVPWPPTEMTVSTDDGDASGA